MKGIEIITHVIPWFFTIISILITVYTIVKNNTKDAKKDAKECAVDTTTVIVKLENLQSTMNRMMESMTSMQTKFENFDHRLTVVETKLALGIADPSNLNI